MSSHAFRWILIFAAFAGGAMGLRSQTAPPFSVYINGGSSYETGERIVLGVSILGSAPNATYQWMKSGTNIPGATTSEYVIASATVADQAPHTVTVTATTGTVTSAAVQPGVYPLRASVITTSLWSPTVDTGQPTYFDILLTGSFPRTFQWRKDGTAIPGATQQKLTLASPTTADAGTYTVVVTNPAGSTVSTPGGVLTVLSPRAPVWADSFSIQSRTVVEGQTTTFSTPGVIGSFPRTYQWKKDGVPVAGGTDHELTIKVRSADAGNYTVTVSNSEGSITSAEAKLTVTAAQPIVFSTVPPLPQLWTVFETSSIALSFSQSQGSTPITYQWWKDGKVVAGATNGQYSITSAKASDAGDYFVVATNAAGSATSPTAKFTVNPGTPVIISQPSGGLNLPAGSISIFVNAVGAPPLSYQWSKDGVAIPGATGISLAVSVQTGSDATYSVVVSNALGAVTSNPSRITGPAIPPGNSLPVIVTQPVSVTTTSAYPADFTVIVSGGQVLYQWYKVGNGVDTPISGATNPSYTIYMPRAEDAGTYYCRITNTAGTVQSANATLTVSPVPLAPSITSQPTSLSAAEGAVVKLSAGVAGTPPFTFRWLKDGAIVAGAVESTLTLIGLKATDAGSYALVVTNSVGSVTSAAATITVNTPTSAPVIVTQPASQVVTLGSTVVFSVVATGATSYQWRFNGAPIALGLGANYSINSTRATDAGAYTVVVTNSAGSTTSAPATLTVSTLPITPPVIVTQPASQVVAAGSSVSFSVVATSASTYQWRFNGVAIPGPAGATYSIASVKPTDGGAYTVVVFNSAGSATSNQATLTVNAGPVTPPTVPAIGSYEGTYSGRLGANGNDGSFAVTLKSDGSGAMLLFLSAMRTAISIAEFKINADGSFNATGVDVGPVPAGVAPANPNSMAMAASTTRIVSGKIAAEGTVMGSVGGYGLGLAGNKSAKADGMAVAGYYQASAVDGGTGSVYAIACTDGNTLVVMQSAAMIDGGNSTLDPFGQLNVATAAGQTIHVALNATTGAITAAAQNGSLPSITFAGLRDDVPRTDRLVNIATRGRAGSGEDAMIAGFVITGNAPRTVLVRAIGPALGNFGIAGALPDPKLTLFRGGTQLGESDNWSSEPNASAIVSAALRVGAFALPSPGRDAVLLSTLEPGNYTAQVTAATGGGGVSLVEVYDAGTDSGAGTPKLINIATRGRVGTGEDVMIAGIVVTGNAPKRVLVRAVGPTLGTFGVAGALTDPVLTILSGSKTLATNDDWSAAAGGTDVAAAAVNVGAFALGSSSRDSALLITLQPGSYTAQVSGKGTATGVALVEVYEVSN